ncbi:hypothetical protein HRI_001575900 [Hibiscus trionum]|uniref:Uncharacterized protein n=1 Tax=Hibiscus trionum TaxID=183268 RepID=A0A9W7HKL4_HIBTR|nr:hypothetical protein HRI_001575900 [Hibiscus trionum]
MMITVIPTVEGDDGADSKPNRGLNGATEAQVECSKPSDCVEKCYGCLVNKCDVGRCECGCASTLGLGDVMQPEQVECQKPSDCVRKCHGCLVNKCDAGRCECGC